MAKQLAHEADARWVLEASALLDITEFRLFQLAYQRWYGKPAKAHRLERYFANYMFCSRVPPWVRHLAREICQKAANGALRRQEYDVQERAPTAAELRHGRRLIAVMISICVLLMLSSYFYQDLLLVFKSCYFPPCY